MSRANHAERGAVTARGKTARVAVGQDHRAVRNARRAETRHFPTSSDVFAMNRTEASAASAGSEAGLGHGARATKHPVDRPE